MAEISKITTPDGTTYDIKDTSTRAGLAQKQDTLVSGTNIKTINNQSLLGSGNITISGGGGGSGVQITLASTAQPLTGSGTQSMASGSNNITFNKMQLISPIDGFAIITGSIQFAANASKTRHAQIECVDSGGGINICADGTILAASGAVTRIPLAGVCQVTTGSTIRVQGWQNSGSALNAGGQITVMYIENIANGDNEGYGN